MYTLARGRVCATQHISLIHKKAKSREIETLRRIRYKTNRRKFLYRLVPYPQFTIVFALLQTFLLCFIGQLEIIIATARAHSHITRVARRLDHRV